MGPESRRSKPQRDEAACYRIRLEGRIDEQWADRLGGMSLACGALPSDGAVVTTLEGRLQDQSALAGVLTFVHDLGLAIISVERTGGECDEPNTTSYEGGTDDHATTG